jgi:DNA-binding PadR family transcriptional regulator
MIISLDPISFQTQDSDIQSILSDILVALLNDNHFLTPNSINSIFFDNENKYIFDKNNIAKNHLSENKKRELKNYISNNRKPITQLHRDHLTHITIGMNSGDIHPENAYRIIAERSKLIVENGINDWKFIRGICNKYSSGKIKRRSIYQLLDRAIDKGLLESDNAGGIGEITKIAQRWIDDARYHNIYQYKLMAIFDSDKKIPDSQTPHIKKIEYFKKTQIENNQMIDYESNDLIIWHVLHKRKIENYLPLNVMCNWITSITDDLKNDLENKTAIELDFVEYDKTNVGIGESKIKEQFPDIFVKSFSYRDLEERCKHHKILLPETTELVSELEQVLLKIAKII